MKPFWPALALLAACNNQADSPKASGSGGLAVLASDGQSTTVSLVDVASGTLERDDCAAALAPPLSGDVVLPSTAPGDGQLLVIDRGRAMLDYLAAGDCHLVRQIDVGTGFAARPEDVVTVSPTKAYVTRSLPNPTPSGEAGALDGGNDILIVDPSTGTLSGRIDLAGQAPNSLVLAGPLRALAANGLVYVTLANLSSDGKVRSAGRLVAIDPATNAVSATVDFPALKGCAGLDYLSASRTLVVGCGGDAGDTPLDQLAQSALVLVSLKAAPTVTGTIGGGSFGGRPLAPGGFAVIGDDFLLAATAGDASQGIRDALWRVQIDAASAIHVLDASDAGVFGSLTWSSHQRRIYVTDAAPTAPAVRVLDMSNLRDIEERTRFTADPGRGLPPHALAWF